MSFLIGTILFYLSNNICEPFTIGNDIQISQNLTESDDCTSAPPPPASDFCKNATNFIELEVDNDGIIVTEIDTNTIYKLTVSAGEKLGIKPIYYINSHFTNNGTLCIESDVELVVNKDFDNNGTIYNNGIIDNSESSTITNSSGETIYNNNLIRNQDNANITNSSGATITNDNLIHNFNNATITNSSGATIINNSNITNCGDFKGSGKVINNGDICSNNNLGQQNVSVNNNVKHCGSGTPGGMCPDN